MIRTELARQLDHDPHFRWRGNTVTRIENLSDIVFALALGMLVSASVPPTTLQGLEAHLIGIIPVSMGFAFMLTIWNAHFTYFRRYGVADGWIIFLNAIMLLAILFIAYPLRFAFDSLFAFIIGQFGDWSRMDEMGIRSYRDAGRILAYYAMGHGALYTLLNAMYSHALKRSGVLGLNQNEKQVTKRSIWRYRADVLLALIVGVCAGWTMIGPFAGFLFALNWPVTVIIRQLIPLGPVEEFEE